jgi:uncharacterized flavoprotein (TIGR03862 family)
VRGCLVVQGLGAFVERQSDTQGIGQVAIIGGGPAGLMAAEVLCARGVQVDLYDAMPSLGRKFLMAGKSGLNLTHAEAFDQFVLRFGPSQKNLLPSLEAFTPDDIRKWADRFDVETFVGTSGRVFPKGMKAAPLLRAWLRQLRAQGLHVHVRHKWTGWSAEGALIFETPAGVVQTKPSVTVLALGGASWPTLGSDGAWVSCLGDMGIKIASLKAANCGFDADWSEHMRTHVAGQPLKGVTLSIADQQAHGDCMVTDNGLEGGPVYTLSAVLRDAIAGEGKAVLNVDLLPDIDETDLIERLSKPRGKKSMATHLRRTVALTGTKSALLREGADPAIFADPKKLAARIKAVPVPLLRARPLAEAISTAGGIAWDQLTSGFEIKAMPGVYAVGEMLDWDAPTGGYLLSACLATGRSAGEAVALKLGA